MPAERPSAWPALLAAQALVGRAIEARLADAGLPDLASYDALWVLEQAPGMRLRMHELASRTVVTRSGITRLVDRLEAAGLVRRERAGDDRRGAVAVLTAAGRDLRRRMCKICRPAIQDLFDRHLSEAESIALRACLLRVAEAMRA